MMARRIVAARRRAAAGTEYTWLLKTTSSDAAYQMESAGATANWEAVYDADGTLIANATGENPTFDLSGNTGNAVVAIRTADAITATATNVIDGWAESSLTFFDASALTSVTDCTYAWDFNNLTSFDASGLTSVTDCWVAWAINSLTSFDASGLATMGIPANNCFTQSWTGGTNALNAASVESILVNIDLSGQSAPATGTDISISTDGSPLTSAAQTAVTNLKSKGWTPHIDGVYV